MFSMESAATHVQAYANTPNTMSPMGARRVIIYQSAHVHLRIDSWMQEKLRPAAAAAARQHEAGQHFVQVFFLFEREAAAERSKKEASAADRNSIAAHLEKKRKEKAPHAPK